MKCAYVLSRWSFNRKGNDALSAKQGETEYSLLLVLLGFTVCLDQTELLLRIAIEKEGKEGTVKMRRFQKDKHRNRPR